MLLSRRSFLKSTVAAAGPGLSGAAKAAPSEIRLDFATYNPLSLVLKEKGLVEKALAPDGINVRWVQ
ncbi:MAG: sulfonate transport system substrate-binding protein, partial [Methylobacteriaceae bacterium]|nr:sulfonate transport system substrate-binding protein [Methylobacteriaceae bacterium]